MRFIIIALMILTTMCCASATEITWTLEDCKDTYVNPNKPNTSYENSPLLYLGRTDIYLSFDPDDLLGFPNEDELDTAILVFNCISMKGTPRNVQVKHIGGNWDEDITWNTRPIDGELYYTTSEYPEVGDWEVNITEVVKRLYDGGCGVLIRKADEGVWCSRLGSSESITPPKVRVLYYPNHIENVSIGNIKASFK